MIIAPEFLFKLPLVTIIITAINIFIFVTTWRMNKSTKHKIDNLKKNIETLNELNKFRHDQDNNMLDMKKH